MGLFGPPNVVKLKARNNVEGLIKALNYQKDYAIRVDAADALGMIGGERAVASLISALRDRHTYVCMAVIEALGRIGDTHAVEPLIVAMRDDNKSIREYSAEALGKIGDERAVESLITALRDSDKDVCMAAVASLRKLNWQPDKGVDGAAYWIAQKKWDCCVDIGEPAVELLIAALKKQPPIFRQGIIEAITKIGIPDMKPLIAALRNEKRSDRIDTIQVMTKTGASVPLLTAFLKDKDRSVRTEVVLALGKITRRHAIKPLLTALRDEFWDVRKAAAKSLDQLGWHPDEDADGAAYWIALWEWDRSVQIGAFAVEQLISVYVRGSEPAFIRRDAIEALEKIGDPRAVAPLIEALRHEDSHVRLASAKSLVKLHKTDSLDDNQKQTILALRSTILGTISTHLDRHDDWPCNHSDHEDLPGIKVEFPL